VKDGMLTLAPLTNLTKLVLDDCGGLRSEGLWHLLAQGRLKELVIWGVHNLLDVPEPSRMCEQDLPQHSSRLQALETDGEAGGAVAVPIGGHFSSSLTELVLGRNNDMEHFTKEQSEALQMLTSLQVLQIRWYSRLQSLPEGLSALPNLRRLDICGCDSFRSLPKDGLPSSLAELCIWGCDAIRSLPKGTLPSSLTELQIISCSVFRSLPKGSLPSSLKTLLIRYCPAIRSLHEGSLPRSIQMLDVTGSNDKLQRQCRKLQGTIPIIKFRD
jgi:Leucine-rich repeat (LRR) protein